MSEDSASEVEIISGRIELAVVARQLVERARTSVCMLTDALDPAIYGSDTFAQAVKNFALISPHSRMRVLASRPAAATRAHHALVDLGRILTSRIEFRELPAERRHLREELLITDSHGLLERQSADSLDARLSRNNPLLGREQQRRFDLLWEESSPAQELRRLGI